MTVHRVRLQIPRNYCSDVITALGTEVALNNGDTLGGVLSVQLVAEVGEPWYALIKVLIKDIEMVPASTKTEWDESNPL